jgi:CRP-like cAMP-binding protein
MSALGISCNIERQSIVTRGVVIEEDCAYEVFLHRTTSKEDEALQLRSLQDALATRLSDMTVDVAVVRVADHHKGRRLTAGVIRRIRAEGLALATLRRTATMAVPLSGKEIGEACGLSKDEVMASAESLLGTAVDATAAALAARQLR